MLDKVFIQILNMSLTASFVMVFVIIARLLLKKAPGIFSYALWVVVLFRLVCPFSFESVMSLLPVNPQPISQDIVFAQTPQINTGLPVFDNAINPVLPAATPEASINPLQVWTFVGEIIWIIGIAVMLIYSVVSLLRLRRRLVGAVKLRDNIYLADRIESPFVIGFFQPKIYLPSALSQDEQGYIIFHEKTHIRRLDHVVKIIAFLALALHWFNPLVWLAFLLCVKDMEMSCDESVMRHMGSDIRTEYSASLLRLATGKKTIAGVPLAFGEDNTKSRIKNVLNYKKPAFWIIIVAFIAVVAVIFTLSSNRRAESGLEPPADEIVENSPPIAESLFRVESFSDGEWYMNEYASNIEYPDKMAFSSTQMDEEAKCLTINISTDTQTKNFYSGLIDEGFFRRHAFTLFAFIHELQRVDFVLDDGTEPYTASVYRVYADSFANGDIWEYSATIERRYEIMRMIYGQIVATNQYPDGWGLQPLYEDEAELNAAFEKAKDSVKYADISVADTGSNEETALAWVDAWIDAHKTVPNDSLARISQGAADRISVTKISKEGKPTGFVFYAVVSVRPTYPILHNPIFMTGNTVASPGRNGTWGSFGREIELIKGDDGMYHCADMGTGGVGDAEDYDLVAEFDLSEISGLGVGDYSKMFGFATKVDGAYAEGLGLKLAKSFEYDAVKFINELSAWDKMTQYSAIYLLVGEYYIDGSNDYARAKAFEAKLTELQTEEKVNQGVLIQMEIMFSRLFPEGA